MSQTVSLPVAAQPHDRSLAVIIASLAALQTQRSITGDVTVVSLIELKGDSPQIDWEELYRDASAASTVSAAVRTHDLSDAPDGCRYVAYQREDNGVVGLGRYAQQLDLVLALQPAAFVLDATREGTFEALGRPVRVANALMTLASGW